MSESLIRIARRRTQAGFVLMRLPVAILAVAAAACGGSTPRNTPATSISAHQAPTTLARPAPKWPDSLLSEVSTACTNASKMKSIKDQLSKRRLPMLMVVSDPKATAWTILTPTDEVQQRLKNHGRWVEKVQVSEFRPANADEIHTVACLTCSEPVVMGHFDSNENDPAYGFHYHAVLLDWPSAKPIGTLKWDQRPFLKVNGPYAPNSPDDVTISLASGLYFPEMLKQDAKKSHDPPPGMKR